MKLTRTVALTLGLWMFISWGWGVTQAAEPSLGSSFEELCQQQASLSAEARKTVEALLKAASTNDCELAAQNLLSRTELSLPEAPITDLRPLAGLTNLKELFLTLNEITDVTPLSRLTNLEKLFLSQNPIVDVTPLAGLTNLTELDLHGNNITDVSPLAGLINLKDLRLNNNEITSVGAVTFVLNQQPAWVTTTALMRDGSIQNFKCLFSDELPDDDSLFLPWGQELCSQLPEISAKKKFAITSTKPVLQQVNSVSKNNNFQNKIAQNSNANDKPNETKNQILLQAIENQDLEGVKAALANGADANAGYPNYFPALVLAASRGNLAIFNTLLEAGADVNLDTGEGETALMYAAVGGHLEMAQILIAKGADVNVEDGGDAGGTALMRAAAVGHIEIVKLLLANGADASIKSLYGDTALALAQKNGYPQIVELLKKSQ